MENLCFGLLDLYGYVSTFLKKFTIQMGYNDMNYGVKDLRRAAAFAGLLNLLRVRKKKKTCLVLGCYRIILRALVSIQPITLAMFAAVSL